MMFVEQRTNTDRSSTCDIANVKFLAKSAVDPNYCLLFPDLFTSNTYTYPMKNRSLLNNKISLIYKEIFKKKRKKYR